MGAIGRGQRNILLSWDELPEFMRVSEVRPYWEILNHRRSQLVMKRVFDVVLSVIMIILLLIPVLIIAIAVKSGSPGPIFYRQIRVTQYGRRFNICKFRTMYDEVNCLNKTVGLQMGSAITVANDNRVTKVGKVLRKYRLDEFPQLVNVLMGDMSFVGTRPEIPKYVENYEKVWLSTLLMPAGITSEASIHYKDEDRMLSASENIDDIYIKEIVPEKMKWNLKSIERFGFSREILTMFRTVFAVLGQ